MSAVVKLSDVLEAIELTNDSAEWFLDRRTGEVIMLTDDMKFAIEEGDDIDDLEDWMREPIQKYQEIEGTDDCLRLPDQHEIHEYAIMEEFVDTVQDNRARQELIYALKGKGAFKRFRDRVRAYKLEQTWYAFRDQAFKEIAIQWLKKHNLEYTEE